ncbi:uncharacterized protein LOC122304957 [Carya illinoinensis]|uniref:uncharacterized protein LOC122304957 n=1 Tax=Carya illinoinensis TaxID=32201 RepID=UPI001C7213E7|nr:uncharacterized protein LOC122304957 [Carya illinoinensis]
MGPYKAPGPDGYSPYFYQSHWYMVGKEVCHAVLSFLKSPSNIATINDTFLVLIPKSSNPKSVSEYRPISLCNVIYKIITKMLTNRLKPIMSFLISPNQCAFVPRRQISDNILAAYETLHTMTTQLSRHQGFMVLKLDMSKAYDRVEWMFIQAVLLKLGFNAQWVALIMAFISSSSFSVLVNGVPHHSFRPGRGLRQGYPLSPYLFILCAEALNSQLLAAEHHRNTKAAIKRYLMEVAGLHASTNLDKYLGLPSVVSMSKMRAFHGIVDKVIKRLDNWRNKFLSKAGKEILIKVVLQALPNYSMSVYLLPKALCSRLHSCFAKFWWGHQDNRTKIHWKSWDFLSSGKAVGGLGFQDLHSFNLALLAKQAGLGSRPSYLWRSMFQSIPLVEEGLMWQVGDGTKIRIWKDKWLLRNSSNRIQSPVVVLHEDAVVAELIDVHTRWWNMDLLRTMFQEDDVQEILKLPLCFLPHPDTLMWKGTVNGLFSVRSAYHLHKQSLSRASGESSLTGTRISVWKRLWSLPTTNAVKQFVWSACTDSLPTRANLHRRKEIVLFVTLARLIWFRRNAWLHDGPFQDPKVLYKTAIQAVDDYTTASSTPASLVSHPVGVASHWQPHSSAWVKVNWDVAVRSASYKLGVGVVICDSNGSVLASLMQPLAYCTNPVLAEARGLIFEVLFCQELGLDYIIFEGDSSQVVHAVLRKATPVGQLQGLVSDVCSLLSHMQRKISHVKRKLNEVAHCLAQSTANLDMEIIDIDCIADCIYSLVLAECHV